MRKKKERGANTFRTRLLRVILPGYAVIILMLAVYVLYLSASYEKRLRESGEAMRNLYVDEMESLLDSGHEYMDRLFGRAGYQRLTILPLSLYDVGITYVKTMMEKMDVEEGIAGFYIQFADSAEMILRESEDSHARAQKVFRGSMSAQERVSLGELLKTWHAQEEIPKGWHVLRGKEKPYLVMTYSEEELHITIVLDFELLSETVLSKYAVNDTGIVFQDDGELLAYSELAEKLEAENAFGQADGEHVLRNRYMDFSSSISHTPLTVHVLVPNASVFTMQGTELVILAILLTAVLLAAGSVYLLQREFIAPLSGMTETMRKISAGQLESEMSPDSAIEEYRQTADTFNEMMREIRELKIQSYEREIGEQKARLQSLQLQIRPHFFLNCLKTLYALLQQGRSEEMEEIILDTSRFFRYVFRDTLTLVTAREELEFTEEYLNIQKNIADLEFTWEVQAEEEALAAPLLPLTIQTFVENSVKHAHPSEKLALRVSLAILAGEEESYLDITVSDNGQGYSREWIRLMNGPEYQTKDGKHVGILNLKRRLRLHYGERAEFAVRNSGGAVSEVVLPLERET